MVDKKTCRGLDNLQEVYSDSKAIIDRSIKYPRFFFLFFGR